MVGSALLRRLERENVSLITVAHSEVDLRRQDQVENFISRTQPQTIFLAAARVGGILANDSRPATFLHDNLMIAANVIEAARNSGVEKLLNLGSTCVYPKLTAQPMPETALLSGPLEPTNQWYAIAKIAAIKLCDGYRRQYGSDFISAMPTNLYGPNDNFDPETSHVIPALITKFVDAVDHARDEVIVWGTGTPKREFLHADDCADALVYVMQHFSAEGPINIGTGIDLTIKELAFKIAGITGFKGRIVFDETRPDGTPQKLSDATRLRQLGWSARIPLQQGLTQTIAWFRQHAPAPADPRADGHVERAHRAVP